MAIRGGADASDRGLSPPSITRLLQYAANGAVNVVQHVPVADAAGAPDCGPHRQAAHWQGQVSNTTRGPSSFKASQRASGPTREPLPLPGPPPLTPLPQAGMVTLSRRLTRTLGTGLGQPVGGQSPRLPLPLHLDEPARPPPPSPPGPPARGCCCCCCCCDRRRRPAPRA